MKVQQQASFCRKIQTFPLLVSTFISVRLDILIFFFFFFISFFSILHNFALLVAKWEKPKLFI